MPSPTAATPLYSHPLPAIEAWLTDCGCQQDPDNRSYWSVKRSEWQASLSLEEDCIAVSYRTPNDDRDGVVRSFKYSLSRQDLEDAIFSGP